jgi:hypothetical protein
LFDQSSGECVNWIVFQFIFVNSGQ